MGLCGTDYISLFYNYNTDFGFGIFVSLYLIIYNTLYSYQWFKNNVKLQTNDRVVVNGESGEIAFKNLTKEDFGMYLFIV